jgi:hypothetical protein
MRRIITNNNNLKHFIMKKIKTLILNAWSHEASKIIEDPAVRQEIIKTFLAEPCCRSNHNTSQIPENGRYKIKGDEYQFFTIDIEDWNYITSEGNIYLLGEYRNELYVVDVRDRQALIGYTVGGTPEAWGTHRVVKVGDILDLLNSPITTPIRWRDYITGSKFTVEGEVKKLFKPVDFGTFGDPTYTGWITKD